MTVDKPYFMNDPKWYTFDFKQKKYVLTDEAPEKAKKSYEEFYNLLNNSYLKDI